MKCLCHFSDPCPRTVGIFNKVWPEEQKIMSRTKDKCNCTPGYSYEYGMYFHARTCTITKQLPERLSK
jgi:hypothetical protein